MSFSDLPQRVLEKIRTRDEFGGCWIWTGSRVPHGYGETQWRKIDGKWKKKLVHRWMYEAMIGEIPAGLQMDHLCRTRSCVNPYHLEPVTQAENRERGLGMQWIEKTRCKLGHELTETNAVWIQSAGKKRHRRCRICMREYSRLRKRRIRNGLPGSLKQSQRMNQHPA